MSRPQTPQSVEKTPPAGDKKPNSPGKQQSTIQTFLLLITVFLCMFLVGLDRTIVSTAILQITNDFNSLSDVGWYGSAYLLTCCAFQLLFGKVYAFYSVKYTYITSLLVFAAASALSGAAPNSVSFIVGRAIAGVGAAGMFAGTTMSVVYTVPLAKRPRIQGIMGAVGGLSSILGPLIGGAFTSKVTWRWCFYINLPICGVAMVSIFFFLNIPDRDTTKLPAAQKLSQLDAPGATFLVPAVVSLLLALQWGGQTYAWSNARIIALLTLFGVLFIGFLAVQALLPKTATIPPHILKQRSIAAASWITICVGSAQYIFIYYLPVWFQAIKGVEPVQSGIRLLPLVMAFSIAAIMGGFINQKIGYYTALAILGSCIMSIGAGLLTTLHVDTSNGKWIGYQILCGFGMGLCFQTPNLATQTVLPKKEVPMGIALMFFGQLLGAAIFVSVGENVLSNQLLQRLSGVPGFDVSLVTSGSATALIGSAPPDQKGTVLVAYNDSLRKIFQIGLILSCLSVLGTVSLEWKNILKQPEAPKPEAPRPEASVSAEKSEAAEEKKIGQTV